MNFKYTPNTLKKLEQLFDEADYIIRYEKGNFNSGYCVLEERRVVVVNKFLNLEGRTNALLELLPLLAINKEKLTPDSIKLLQQIGQKATEETNSTQGTMNLQP